MILLPEAEPAPDEIKYSIVISNYVFQHERRIPRRDPGGIPVSAGNLGGIPARSRYLFYKGE